MTGGVSQDTVIAVAFMATTVTFSGGLLGAVKQEVRYVCRSHEMREISRKVNRLEAFKRGMEDRTQ